MQYKLEFVARLKRNAHQFHYVNGEEHFYLGRKYRLKIKQGDENNVQIKNKFLCIVHKNKKISTKKIKLMLDAWYHEHAKIYFEKVAHDHWSEFKFKRRKIPRMRVRKMKTCWGTISLKTHTITINTDLIKTPKPCIEYVIYHELCHLRSMYHNQHFYECLDEVLPEWRKRRARLDRWRF